jgi:hypothetical protein
MEMMTKTTKQQERERRAFEKMAGAMAEFYNEEIAISPRLHPADLYGSLAHGIGLALTTIYLNDWKKLDTNDAARTCRDAFEGMFALAETTGREMLEWTFAKAKSESAAKRYGKRETAGKTGQ